MGEYNQSLLKMDGVTIGFKENGQTISVVDNLSFSVEPGEIFGIVGESGSGKTMLSLSIMGLLAEDAKIISGGIIYNGVNLLELDEEACRKLRGKELAMIFQEPMTSLNPVLTIGFQVNEMLELHEQHLMVKERKKRVLQALKEAGLTDTEELYKKYPHQLSGGMRQRVMIAMAMICKPKLLIADEPTTALDVTIQAKILDLLKDLSKKYGTSILLISHDLGVVQNICNRAIVMQQGKLVEIGEVSTLFQHPKEEYTKKLVESVPGCHNNLGSQVLSSYEELTKCEQSFQDLVVEVQELSVGYQESGTRVFSKVKEKEVLRQVSFGIRRGEILGVVGESGSGKSTLAKALMGFVPYQSGSIYLDEKRPQMVFQDPYGSLNPAKKIGWILEEPLKLLGGMSKQQRHEKVSLILEKVGFPKGFEHRYLHQLSGGQRQRVAIGVALMQNSKFIVLDEPVSALDVTVQSQILKLLTSLKDEFDLTYLFISHDLNVIYELCDRVLVMLQGKIVEAGTVEDIFANPKEEYTKSLLAAVYGFAK